VEVAIPGGREVAERTFNPRLGIVGGLSILGTTGIVRPYCRKALRDSLECSLDVAAACGVRDPVLVPGNIGAKAARSHFALAEEQVIEVGNEWGYVLDLLFRYPFAALLVAGHPGKLAKLAAGDWDTHSARSASPVGLVGQLCREVLGQRAPESPTVEGLFAALDPTEQKRLADSLAGRVRAAVSQKISGVFPVAVLLVNMAGRELGSDGDLTPWRRTRSQS
jgi:cobalt-precorrin-5B (C1)-methyltransferase